jgi:signal transduction histidine kinase
LLAVADGLVVGALGLTVSWHFVGQAVLEHSAGGWSATAISLAYPVLDVVVVSAAGYAISFSSGWARPIIGTVAVAWICNAVADSAFVSSTAIGSYHTGLPIDIGWVAGFTLAGLAGLMAASAAPWPDPVPGVRPRLAAFVVYGALAAAGLAIAADLAGAISPVERMLRAAVVVVLVLRAVLNSIDNHRLDRARVAAVEALRASEGRLHQVLEQAPVVIFTVDSTGIITLAKGQGVPEVANSVGFNLRTEAPGHPLHSVIDPALEGLESQGEVMVRGRLLQMHCNPVVVNGAVTGMVGVAIDITDRRAAERARRESEAKDRFLASMSHELRTPLNSILGFAQMLGLELHGGLTTRQRRYVDNILGSGQQLLDLVTEVLDLAKVSAGQLDVEIERTGLEPVVAEALAMIRPQADGAGLTLEVTGVEDLEVMADPGRLRQVLLNLLSNAVKFTPSGGRVTVRGCVRDGDFVNLEVEDTGVGIALEDQDRIFQEFTQLEAGRNRTVPGTGLGLALSRALVRRMGGDVTVRSLAGKGSTFLVRLPAASVAGGQLAHELSQPA